MKKLLILCLVLALTLCGCGTKQTNTTTESTDNTLIAEEESQEELLDADAIGDIEVDKNLFTVELTIPSDYVGETTQEELDATAEEKGYKSITLNNDGSATYVMTKEQHETLMDEYSQQINDSLKEMIGSEDYPNFTNIEANDNFTEFTVTTKSVELDLNESFSVIAFYMYGGMYNVFNGEDADNISVTFINADTGDVISTSNSKDM